MIDPCALQTAINLSVDGEEVLVAGGTYALSSTLTISESIVLQGGYNPANWSEPDPVVEQTILDGGNARRVIHIQSGAPAIEGFVIQHGRASQGAGIYVESGAPTIRHNWIHSNVATSDGAGIYDGGGSSIEGNEIYENRATGNGAGIALSNNGSTEILLNAIYGNRTTGSFGAGGGIHVAPDSSATIVIEANVIYGNQAYYGGGFISQQSQVAQLLSNLFYLNQAQYGGAIFSLGPATIWNSTIVDNDAAAIGGGIYVGSGSTTISNTIIAYNDSASGNDGVALENGSASGGYNHVYDDAIDPAVVFTNPIDPTQAPAFLNRSAHNYHLAESSPDVDAGDPNTEAAVDVDIDGEARPNGARVDVGADEFYPATPLFSLQPQTFARFVEPGSTVRLVHTVRNQGTISDTYTFACSDTTLNWTISTCPQPLALNVGETAEVTTIVEVPAVITPYAQTTVEIEATSAFSPSLSHVAVANLIVAPEVGLSFTPNYSEAVEAGETLTFTHILTNTGNYSESYRLQVARDPEGWAQLLPSNTFTTTPLAPGEARAVRLAVNVAPYAPAGIQNVIQVKASSVFSPAVAAFVTDTVTAKATVGTRYVSPGGSDANNNCTQRQVDGQGHGGPCRTLAHALTQASGGDDVWLARGTYDESGINLNSRVQIAGGWNSTFQSQGDPDATIIDAGGGGRIFNIAPGSSIQPSLSNLTLQNGTVAGPGGAIFVGQYAQPRLSDLIIRNNSGTTGGAIYAANSSFLSLRHVTLQENDAGNSGGALYLNAATLSLQQSRLLSNTAAFDGGALYHAGGLILAENDLFYANEAGADGGAWFGSGGDANSGNNTVVANSAAGDGGAYYNDGATLSVHNGIVADNSAGNGGAVYAGAGETSVRYSDVWNNTPNAYAGPGSLSPADNISADPQFGDDQFRLPPGSPAVDSADPDTTLAVDFEGDFRPSDQGFDMGYDELAGCRAKRGNVVYGSIQDAIDGGGEPTILVSGICRGVHPLPGNPSLLQTVHLREALTIQGGWNGDFSRRTLEETIIDPGGQGRGLYLDGTFTATLSHLTVQNGDAGGLGGGPAGADAGGGIYNLNGNTIFEAVSVYSSTATVGGAFYNQGGAPQLRPDWPASANADPYPGHFVGNRAERGGAIYTLDGALVADSIRLHRNTASAGGAFYNDGGNPFLANVMIYENEATDGAALYNDGGQPAFWHLTLYANTADGSGGGLYQASGSTLLRNTIFQENEAADGAGIFGDGGSVDADYNYYYPYAEPPVAGIDAGSHSVASATTAPGLLDPAAGNFRLEDGAAAADSGDPGSPVGHDFENNLRPSNQGFDVGADEQEGCYAQIAGQAGVLYGSIQEALKDAQPDAEILVAGRCSGTHPFDTANVGGDPAVCGATVETTVHIAKNVTLNGRWQTSFASSPATLDAEAGGHVIYVAPGSTATITGFRVTGGNVEGNGAGICVDNASPTIRDNQIYSNTAGGAGGGIYAGGAASPLLDGNHIHGNTASSGGGLGLDLAAGASADLWTNFIYENGAANGAGFYNGAGSSNFWHNTVVANTATTAGGGLYVGAGSPSIRSNIVAGNSAGAEGGGIYAAAGPTLDYNDFYDNTPDNFAGGTSAGAHGISVAPGFVTGDGNPFTLEYASPVVDQGDPALPLYRDYEGDIRPSHQGYDIGADEVGGCFSTVAEDPERIIYGSVQQAVSAAQAGNTVYFDGLCLGANTQFIGTDPVRQTVFLDKSLTLDGSWDYPAATVDSTLDPRGAGRAIYVASSTTATITHATLAGGDATAAGFGNDNGGGLYNDGTLLLRESVVRGNSAGDGGGLYNGGTLTVLASSFLTNSAGSRGGGIYHNGNSAIIRQESRFDGNQAGAGGAVYQSSGSLLVDGNRFHENDAAGDGGAFYLDGGTSADLWNNFIYRNSAGRGGGIFNLPQAGKSARILFNTLVQNRATNTGGGLYLENGSSGEPLVQNNIVDRNQGNGIYVGTAAALDYNNVVGNTPGDYVNTSGGSNSISATPRYQDFFEDDFHLRDSSPGVDQGIDLVVDHDYDGDIRPTNRAPDIGADELPLCLVRVGGPGGAIFGVLQEAITHAEDNGLTRVDIAYGECKGVDDLGGHNQVAYVTTDLKITGSLTRDFGEPEIYARYAQNATMVNAEGQGRALYVEGGANPTFRHIAFVQGDASGQGGAPDNIDAGGGVYIGAAATPFFDEVTTCQSTASAGGGYYAAAGSHPRIKGGYTGECRVITSLERQGGEYIPAGARLFEGNTAAEGGAYYFGEGATTDIVNHGFWANQASGDGGAVYNAAGGWLVNGVFRENRAGAGGGGLYNGGPLRLYHNTFSFNQAGGDGGAIYNDDADFVLNSSLVYQNDAGSGSAAVHSSVDFAADYNNFYDNSPAPRVGFTTGANSIFPGEDPRVVLGWFLTQSSPLIDQADPALLDPGVTEPGSGALYPIDHDANNVHRPDGHRYPDTFPTFNEGYAGSYDSDIGADEYQKDFGCAVDVRPNSITATPGDVVTYTVTITNTGYSWPPRNGVSWNGYTDTLSITLANASQGWAELAGQGVDGELVELGWMEDVTRILTVTVPADAGNGLQDRARVQCASMTLPARSGGDTALTNIGEVLSLEIQPAYLITDVNPGDVFTVTYTITNSGNSPGQFRLAPNSGRFSVAAVVDEAGTAITPTVSLGAGEATTALLRVTILDAAPGGEITDPGIVAYAAGNPQLQAAGLIEAHIGYISGTRYVAQGGTSDESNCTDPQNPCATIQQAIAQAAAGDSILVAAGRYTDAVSRTVGAETVEQLAFVDKSLTIRGGYSVVDEFANAAPIANAVHLDGQGQRRVLYLADGVTVTLSGLVVENGQATSGGGLYNAGASLTISGTWFMSNTASTGGGLYHSGGPLTATSLVFASNDAQSDGAGLTVAGGSATVANNTFAANQAGGNGGGFYQADGTLALFNNIFAGNNAGAGSAAYVVTPGVSAGNDYNLYYDNQGTSTLAGVSRGGNSLDGQDPDFVDAYYHISGSSPAKDSGTDQVPVRFDFEGESRPQGNFYDIGADERTQRPAFTFTPAAPAQVILDPGETYTFTHTLRNVGDFGDSYSLSIEHRELPPDGWAYHLSPASSIPTLEPGESVTVTLVVSGSTQPGYRSFTTITATANSGVVHSVADGAIITYTAGVSLSPGLSAEGAPGETISYTHTLTNTGTGADSFALSLAQNAPPWNVAVLPPQTEVLAAGASMTFTVAVTIPGDAAVGSEHLAQIEARSTAFPSAHAFLTDTAVVRPPAADYQVLVVPNHRKTALPGTTITYTHTISNIGSAADTYTVTATSSQGWLSGWQDLPGLQLDPQQGQTIVLTLAVPAGSAGSSDTTTVTVRSQTDPTAFAFAFDETTVVDESGDFDVTIAPAFRSQSVAPGTQLHYTHTVTNTGATADSYTLSLNSNQMWASLDQDTIPTLAPGAATTITLTVNVPATAPTGAVEEAVVTVSSAAGSASASATDLTLVVGSNETAGLALSPAPVQYGVAGETVHYTHLLTNTGTTTDVVTLESSGSWPSSVTPAYLVLGSGETGTLSLAVTIPPGTPVGRENQTQLSARSQISPTVAVFVSDTTIVTATPPANLYLPLIFADGSVEPPPIGERGVQLEWDWDGRNRPGSTLRYYHLLQNTGTVADSYTLSASTDLGWSSTVAPLSVTLAPGEMREIMVTITINKTAAIGQVGQTTVTARSLADSSVSAQQLDRTTVCAASGIDLVVTGIAVTPANPGAGEEATVAVTIRNQGTKDVPFGNNFFLDLYVDQEPRLLLPGQDYWGVQGATMRAGTSKTFSTRYTFGGGTHALWAQVDTDDTVPGIATACEDDENNNIYGPLALVVSGNAGSGRTGPAQAPAGSRATPTPLPTPSPTPTPLTAEETPLPQPTATAAARLLPAVETTKTVPAPPVRVP